MGAVNHKWEGRESYVPRTKTPNSAGVMLHNKGQRLTLGGCEAPSRGEGQALPGDAGHYAK